MPVMAFIFRDVRHSHIRGSLIVQFYKIIYPIVMFITCVSYWGKKNLNPNL